MKPLDECAHRLNEEFLRLLEDFDSSHELQDRLRGLCRISGYLRFLFFEILEENVESASGGDLITLVCGIPLLIMRSMALCGGSGREVACSVITDSLSLALLIARKLGKGEWIAEMVNDIQFRLQEALEIDEDLHILLRDFSDHFIRSFG